MAVYVVSACVYSWCATFLTTWGCSGRSPGLHWVLQCGGGTSSSETEPCRQKFARSKQSLYECRI